MSVPFSLDAAPLSPIPRPGERALVIAPHPDDETLGAGGWIYSARRNGADVRIFFLTDGDAFRLAALTTLRRFPNQAACRALGARRREEAILAAAALGVEADSLRFLGYPDRGLEALKGSTASPYRSPYTGQSAAAERSSIPNRPYLAENLRQDLFAALDEYRPHYVLMPDPGDDHPDHRAGAWFAGAALSLLGEDQPEWVGRYLIHCGLWPLPHRFEAGVGLTPPPKARLRREWTRYPQSPSALQAKARALSAHSSQHLWAADLLGAHLRTNELFSRYYVEDTLTIASNPPRVLSCGAADGVRCGYE